MRIKHETYATVLQTVYTGLATNALLLLGCAPLVIGLVVTDPLRSWPLLALIAPLCTPAVVAAFAVLSGVGSGSADPQRRASDGIVRQFGRAWLSSWRRATALGAMATAALVVLGVDAAWAWGRPIGAAALPVFAMLAVLVVATGLLSLVALAERPAARLRDVLRCSVYLAVRRWYLTALSLLTLGLLAMLFAGRPALAVGLAASPLLYVVWANSRFSLRPALDPPTPA
jgi:uncharacterized membrane protein YesL